MQQFMHANLAAKRREGAQRGAPSTSVVPLCSIGTPPLPHPLLLLLLLMLLTKMMMALKLQMMMMASFPQLPPPSLPVGLFIPSFSLSSHFFCLLCRSPPSHVALPT